MQPLAEVTSAFAQAIWHGETSALSALTLPSPAHDARIRIYRNNVFVSLVQALGDLYPRVRRLTGAEFFDQAARSYLRAHPPQSPAMVHFGASFPVYLLTLEALTAYPYVCDVAKAELAWHQAYHAAEAVPLGVAALSALNSEQMSRAHLTLHPSAKLLASPYALDVLWELSAGKAEPAANEVLPKRGAQLLIIRPVSDVEVRIVPQPVFILLQALSARLTVLDACEYAQREQPGSCVPSILRDLIVSGTFVAVETNGDLQ